MGGDAGNVAGALEDVGLALPCERLRLVVDGFIMIVGQKDSKKLDLVLVIATQNAK